MEGERTGSPGIGDNLHEHPFAMATMPLFLVGAWLKGGDAVAMVGSVQGGHYLAPLLVLCAVFAAQGLCVAGLITAVIKTSKRIE